MTEPCVGSGAGESFRFAIPTTPWVSPVIGCCAGVPVEVPAGALPDVGGALEAAGAVPPMEPERPPPAAGALAGSGAGGRGDCSAAAFSVLRLGGGMVVWIDIGICNCAPV